MPLTKLLKKRLKVATKKYGAMFMYVAVFNVSVAMLS